MSFATALKRVIPSPVAQEAPDGEGAATISRWQRLRAWWEGVSVEEIVALDARRAAESAARAAAAAESAVEVALAPVASSPEDAPPFDSSAWTAERIAINEMLFGAGEIRPGGVARTIDLIGSFGLGQDVNVLQIGAGLGGPARAIAIEYQGWVTGYEADADLAAAAMAPERLNVALNDTGSGMKKSKAKVKLADKARVEHADFETLSIKKNVFDCAFACEVLNTVADKARLIDVIREGLKPQGALMLYDYFVKEEHKTAPEVQRWSADGNPHPWTLAEAKAMLAGAGFDLRVVKDMTAEARSDILRAFGGFVLDHKRGDIAAPLIRPLLHVTAHWAERVALIDAGMLEVCKLQAFRTGN